MAVPYADCHAKTDESGNPGINVESHLRHAAAVCLILGQQLPLSLDPLGKLAVPSASVHDVGKVSPGFQLKYFRDALSLKNIDLADKPAGHFVTDHAYIGACSLWSYLNPDDFSPCPTVAQIAAMHHGSVRTEPLPTDTGELLGGEAWSKERKRLIDKMQMDYGSLSFNVPSVVQRDFISGMVTISDWIGSDETFFPPEGLSADITIESAARAAVQACGLIRPDIIPGLSFEEIFGFSPHKIQDRFGALVADYGKPGVFVLEAPMGMGKTEAALYAAYLLMAGGQNTGFFFGLPTRLTSDRIHERIDPFLRKICEDPTGAKLAHGTAWLKPFWQSSFGNGGEDFRPGHAWFNPRKRALLHPFVVGTVDQALMSVLRIKHHFVRTYGLAGKVVILDEVHSYDGYTGALIETMAFQLTQIGCSVIILSATLTGKRRAAFFNTGIEKSQDGQKVPRQAETVSEHTGIAPYPLISGSDFCEASSPLTGQIYSIRLVEMNHPEMAKHVVKKALQGHCVLCIANTVATAQTWFDQVSAEMPEKVFPIGLLHSKFPGFQRAEIEDLWMKRLGKGKRIGGQKNNTFHAHEDTRPKGCILIATQVVEQSVDIDADYLVTELAPTDMLLQRMGRQFRHTRDNRPCKIPETLILSGNPDQAANLDEVVEAFGRSNCHVYAPWVLWRTLDVWKTLKTVTLPDDIRPLIESTYEDARPKQKTSLDPSSTRPNGDDLDFDSSEYCQLKVGLMDELYDKFLQCKEALASRAMGNLSTVTAMPVGEDHEACATRYSDLPTTQVLLVRDMNSTGNEAKLTLLDQEHVVVNASKPDLAVTAKLHLNLVTIPTWLLCRFGPPATPVFLKKHFFEATPVLLWDEIGGELTLNGAKTDFRYSPLKGLFRKLHREASAAKSGNDQALEKGTTNYLSDFESMDLFDKSKFDW